MEAKIKIGYKVVRPAFVHSDSKNGKRTIVRWNNEDHIASNHVRMRDIASDPRVQLSCRSCVNNGMVIEYKPGGITERPPESGPLAVFKRFRFAKDFVDCTVASGGRMIYKCQYIESEDRILWVPVQEWGAAINGVRQPAGFSKQYMGSEPPHGTVYADCVRLSEKPTWTWDRKLEAKLMEIVALPRDAYVNSDHQDTLGYCLL